MQRPPSRTHGVAWIQGFALDFAPSIRPIVVHYEHGPGYTAARQLFGLAYYKAGQLQAPCSAFEEVPEPRPTNPLARSSYYHILALIAQSGRL